MSEPRVGLTQNDDAPQGRHLGQVQRNERVGDVHVHRPLAAPWPTPHQLPMDVLNFVGRTAELAELDAIPDGEHPVDLGDMIDVNCSDCHTGSTM